MSDTSKGEKLIAMGVASLILFTMVLLTTDIGRSTVSENHSPKGIVMGEEQFGIGKAIEVLRNGGHVRREGWNGKGMWLNLQVPDEGSKMTLPYIYIQYPVGHIAYPDGSLVPWLASQTDILAEDWEEMIIEEE